MPSLHILVDEEFPALDGAHLAASARAFKPRQVYRRYISKCQGHVRWNHALAAVSRGKCLVKGYRQESSRGQDAVVGARSL